MKCTYEGCEKPSLKRSLCEAHYCKLRRSGALPMKAIAARGAPLKWLMESASYQDEACLVWPFFRDEEGYGRTKLNGVNMFASRAMCIIVNGNPPFSEAHAAHVCGNGHRGCVNPKHLYWATSQENNLDRKKHGTMPVGERSGMSKLTEAQVLNIHADRRASKLVAAEHGVHHSCVEAIRYGKTWSWLTGGRVDWVVPGYETRSRAANVCNAEHPS